MLIHPNWKNGCVPWPAWLSGWSIVPLAFVRIQTHGQRGLWAKTSGNHRPAGFWNLPLGNSSSKPLGLPHAAVTLLPEPGCRLCWGGPPPCAPSPAIASTSSGEFCAYSWTSFSAWFPPTDSSHLFRPKHNLLRPAVPKPGTQQVPPPVPLLGVTAPHGLPAVRCLLITLPQTYFLQFSIVHNKGGSPCPVTPSWGAAEIVTFKNIYYYYYY